MHQADKPHSFLSVCRFMPVSHNLIFHLFSECRLRAQTDPMHKVGDTVVRQKMFAASVDE